MLDVRTVADYEGPGGHVPGAKNVPLEELPQRLGELKEWRGRPLNGPPYGDERSDNALRLAISLIKREGEQLRVSLIGDAASCARRGQSHPRL